MSVRNKIITIVAPLMIISILAINFIFSAFFSKYLEDQENGIMNSVGAGVFSYINERAHKYQGNANDWGHWDDTDRFMTGDAAYVDSNLTEETFNNLDVNFMIYLNDNGTVYYKRYYDFLTESFSGFPGLFLDDFSKAVSNAMSDEDTSAIFELGGEFYFVASSGITDSLMTQIPAGKLIIGRLINIADIEKVTGCSLISVKAAPLSADENTAAPAVNKISKDEKKMKFEYVIPAHTGGATVILTFEKRRDLFISGMNELYKFVMGSAIYSIAVVIILFTLMWIYISKPFRKLITEVKNIDLKAIKKMDVRGKDEFAFLRTTINGMLEQIENAQTKVRENEEKLYATLLSVGDGVIVVSRDSAVQFINPTAQRLTGWTQPEAMGMPFDDVFKLKNELTGETIESPIKEVFETEAVIEIASHTILISKAGKELAIEDTAAPVKDKNEDVVGCVLVFRDISEKKEKQKKIEFLSYHDQLTGLYNRRYFEEELRRLDTKRNMPISLIYADVNGLKILNDAFGHQSGDQLIRKTANVLRDECRCDDIISRTGGDEFIILLTKTDKDSAEALVERINKKIEKQRIMGIPISLSFGWDTKYSEELSIWDTLKSAEDSMYHKKIILNPVIRSSAIESVLKALYAKSPPEEAHSKRVGELCEAIGEAEGIKGEPLRELKTAGEMHDIGKITIDSETLNNVHKLSESEWVLIRSHPETGYRILSTANEFYNISKYVLAHHERWEGKGYPKGLKGKDIPKNSRIIAIADAFDSMTRSLPYRKAISQNAAIEELKKNAGSQFDPGLVKTFTEKVLGKEI